MTKDEFIHAVENVFQKGKYCGSDEHYNVWKDIQQEDIAPYYTKDSTYDDVEHVADVLMDEFR